MRQRYLGVKMIEATPMKHGDYAREKYGENKIETDFSKENRYTDGYKVVYEDGYVSWSPKEVFEKAYRLIDKLTFGLAIEAMKLGKKVAREGWNGKGMWLILQITPPTTSMYVGGKYYGFLPYIQMKTVDDKMVPWLASQTDILAEDWFVM
jgi:hypothetical protein